MSDDIIKRRPIVQPPRPAMPVAQLRLLTDRLPPARMPPRPGGVPVARAPSVILPPRAPAPVASAQMPVIKDSGGDFRSFGGGLAKIPLKIIFAPQQTLSVLGWKMLAYFAMLSYVPFQDVSVAVADVQAYVGGRITPAQVREEFRFLTEAKFSFDNGLREVVHAAGDSVHTLVFYRSAELYLPRGGDKEDMRRHQYSLVDLRHVRKFKTVAHLRAYILFRYQSRLKNNIRLITPDDARWVFGAPPTKKWGNVQQDHIKPAVFAVEAVAGLHINLDIEYATTRGGPVRGVKLTCGSRFKTRDHHIYARAERAGRQRRKDLKEFEGKLDSAIQQFDPAFLSQAKARYAIEQERVPLDQLVKYVRYLSTLDWQDVYKSDRQRALDYTDDGQFAAAVLVHIEKLASDVEQAEADRKREDLERTARELALDQSPDRIALRNFESDWDREVAEQAEKDRLIGTDDYQCNLFDYLPTVKRRDKIFDI